MSFKPLLLAWAVVLGVVAGAAGAVQVLGPPTSLAVPPRVAILPPRAPVPAAPAAPLARALPSRPDPAPALRMTLASIPEPDPALLEPAPGLPGRMLPRVGANGHVAARQYAAAFDPAERHPRIAIVLDGVGLDRALTAQAGRTLPAAIDFAFSAYAPAAGAAALAREGRLLGRECLVSVPMEPNGYPATEEGERALLTGADPMQSRLNLDWALSSVAGCVGATGASDGMGGERFAGETQSFADVLGVVARRGLIYLDPRPGAALPDPPGLAVYATDVVIDRAAAPDWPADAQAIDRNLASLEQVAARRGAAVGVAGPPTPVLVDRLAVWAHGLAARGLVLAPLTAIPPRPAAQIGALQ